MNELNLLSDSRFQMLLRDVHDDPSGVDNSKVKIWLAPGEELLYDEVRSSIGNAAAWSVYMCLIEISRLRTRGAAMIDEQTADDDPDGYHYDILFPYEHDDIKLEHWLTGEERDAYGAYMVLSDDMSRRACTCLRVMALIRRSLAEFIVENDTT